MSAFAAQREGGAFPQAIVISDAGSEEANGIYKASDRLYCDAPIYEHVDKTADLQITREPHTNSKGVTKYGWLIGLKKSPLYGAPTENLVVPSSGWKKFNGEAPVPKVSVRELLVDVFYAKADDAKAAGDAAAENQDWVKARDAFADGLNALKQSGERFGDGFKNRAALLLSRRASANCKLEDFRPALRDAVASLELVRGLASAEVTAVEASRALGAKTDAIAQKILEPLGGGKILDSGAPLVLRAVDRWVGDVIEMFELDDPDAPMPQPRHLPSDRYLDGMDDKEREEIIKRYLPELFVPPGGTGILKDPADCLALMRRWEEVFNGSDFQDRRKNLWNRPLSYPDRLMASKKMVAESLADVLEPMGFAPGQPGLTRVIGQMQHYWSQDKACAAKALDLEELADVSLADLQ